MNSQRYGGGPNRVNRTPDKHGLQLEFCGERRYPELCANKTRYDIMAFVLFEHDSVKIIKA